MPTTDRLLLYAITAIATVAMVVAAIAYVAYLEWRRTRRRNWLREEEQRVLDAKRHDEELANAADAQRRQEDWETRRYALDRKRVDAETKRIEEEQSARYETARAEEERAVASNSGAGSGGYHLLSIDESDRSLFHDLLKGFEDYCKLKGYSVSFSIDNSWEGRTAYKFTVLGKGVVVGSEQVRDDFREYVDRVRKDDDGFEDIPVVTSIAEHNLVVTMLKNRIIFFRTNYSLYKSTVAYFEMLIANNRFFPAQPQPSIIVQNGVAMDSRSFSNTNSPRSILGDGNTVNDSSINIGGSVNEKMERINALDELIAKLRIVEARDPAIAKAELDLTKVRDELADYPEPNELSIRRWLEHAKNLMTAAILGHELFEAAAGLWHLFGM